MSEEIIFIYLFIYFILFFFSFFAFWFPLQPINMNSDPKHTWLMEDFSRNSSIKVLILNICIGLVVHAIFQFYPL